MSKLNRIAQGLLDLFGSLTQGQNPAEYADVVAPVVDVGDLYLGDTMSVLGISATHAAAGDTFSREVPLGETWKVLGLGVTTILDVGELESWHVLTGPLARTSEAMTAGSPTSMPIWHPDTLNVQINGQQAAAAIVFGQALVLQSGAGLGFVLGERDTAAARTSSLGVLLQVLRGN